MENWNTTLYDSMRSPDLGYVIPSIYYVVWIFIGNFILLNLFLAILLDSFLTEDDEDDEDDNDDVTLSLRSSESTIQP